MASSGRFRALKCPQNSVICVKRLPKLLLLIVVVAWLNSSDLVCLSSIQNPPVSFMNSALFVFHHSTSILLNPSSIFHLQLIFLYLRSEMGDFGTQNVLKIAGFSTKHPQVSLALLAAFSRFDGDICPGNICPGHIYPYQEYLSSTDPILTKL